MNQTNATQSTSASAAWGIPIVAATIASASYLYFKQIEPIKIISSYLLINMVSEAVYSYVIKSERWYLPHETGKERVFDPEVPAAWHMTNTYNVAISAVFALALGSVAYFCRGIYPVTAKQTFPLIFIAACCRLNAKIGAYKRSNKFISNQICSSKAVAHSESYGFITQAISTIFISILLIKGKVPSLPV